MDRQYTRGQGGRLLSVSRLRPWRVPLPLAPRNRAGGLSPLVLVYGFGGLIALGTLLLALPISSKSGDFTPPIDAFFTATSAVCVTGLVVVDTGTYWSSFGQGVILALIQVGGFGFMASATLLLLLFGRRIGLRERMLIAGSLGIGTLGGLVKLVRRMALFALVCEVLGAALLYLRFSGEGSVPGAVWESVFQSVSAFNNAGFDVFGDFRSMQDFRSDVPVVLITAALVIIGGISFVFVANAVKARRFGRLSFDSKIVLVTTVSLLGLGMVVFLVTEYASESTLGPLSVPEKLLVAFFQSVTPRTAGFTTVDIGQIADYTLFFTILLMFVGGAAGSTAGGVKVNTFGMLMATIWSSIRGREHAGAFGREFVVQQVHRALAVVMLSLGLISIVVLVLTITEEFRFLNLFFETVSAFGTVGLSTGITPELTTAGKAIIMVTMFVGRLGPLALALALIQRQRTSLYRYPHETIRIG